jgi:DNA-binding transcriptional LysR family regulator
MPLHMVEEDIAAGTLVVLDLHDIPQTSFALTICAYHQPSEPPGPAGRWFIDHLKASWEQQASSPRKR